jgi:hypothetical protein
MRPTIVPADTFFDFLERLRLALAGLTFGPKVTVVVVFFDRGIVDYFVIRGFGKVFIN